MTLLDTVNLVYVAMTRPIDRLYVLTKEVEIKDNDRSVQGMFMKFAAAEDKDFVKKGTGLEFGTDKPLAVRKIAGADDLTISGRWVSEPWKQRIRISARTPAEWDVFEPERSGAWGNLVHSALAAIRSSQDINRVVAEMVNNRLIAPEKEEEMKRMLNAVTGHPDLEKYFSGQAKIRTESEIILPDGSVLRPDRVILADNEGVIIDYKTGKPLPAHAAQLGEYAGILKETGYKKIRKLLVYIDEDVLVDEV
jgi:ATP-dependent exoDNAse (exonuclease V) beta subunit